MLSKPHMTCDQALLTNSRQLTAWKLVGHEADVTSLTISSIRCDWSKTEVNQNGMASSNKVAVQWRYKRKKMVRQYSSSVDASYPSYFLIFFLFMLLTLLIFCWYWIAKKEFKSALVRLKGSARDILCSHVAYHWQNNKATGNETVELVCGILTFSFRTICHSRQVSFSPGVSLI